MRPLSWRRVVLPAASSAVLILVTAGVASAHIHPDPLAMAAGTSGTVGFTIEHGCDASPTTDLKIQIPAGVTGVSPVDKDGWTATVAGDTVEFKGGSLPADQEDHFDLTLTVPSQPGDVNFKIIQTCTVGELDWIEIQAEGAPEPEHPAATLKVTDGPPTSADLTPEPEETDAAGTMAPSATTVAAAPAKDSSNTGTIVVVVIVAVVVLAGGGALLVRRRNTAPKT